jgi:hypothetical protein
MLIVTNDACMGMQEMEMPKYKTLRIPVEDYEKLKEIQRLLRKKGSENVDWESLKLQDYIEVPDEEEQDESASGFTAGVVIGLGAAALAYLLWKGQQESK